MIALYRIGVLLFAVAFFAMAFGDQIWPEVWRTWRVWIGLVAIPAMLFFAWYVFEGPAAKKLEEHFKRERADRAAAMQREDELHAKRMRALHGERTRHD